MPKGRTPTTSFDFHIAEPGLLIMNNRWCSSASDWVLEKFPGLFREHVPQNQSNNQLWLCSDMPLQRRLDLLEQKARESEEEGLKYAEQEIILRKRLQQLEQEINRA